jgi:sugar lactone lactonase YvrE
MRVWYADATPLLTSFAGIYIVHLKRISHLWHMFLCVAVAALSACGSAPTVQDKTAEVSGPIFYPPEPGAPRIQWLTSFTGENDFAGKASGFAEFVGGSRDAPQRLVTIYGVAMFDSKIFAVDSKAATFATFDLIKKKYSTFGGSGGGKLKLPINITIDAEGTKYITDTGRNQVVVYDRDNRFVSAFGDPDQFRPVDTAIVQDKLYVVDILHNEIQVLHKRTGKLLFKFGKMGGESGELLHPTNIAIAPNGDVFVVETSNFRVQRFTPDGKPVRVYGEVGDTSGKFARPKGIAIDREGLMHVADAAFQNVQVFDTNTGKLLLAYGQPEKGDGMSLPAAVKVDYEHIALFQHYADPKFKIDYLVLVTSQVAPNKIDVFGYGKLAGADYTRVIAPQ